MARDTMSDLITALRAMTNAGTVDFTLAGTSYFTDDQMQGYLDYRRIEVVDKTYAPIGEYVNGATQYTRYPLNATDWEGGTVLAVKDTTGTAYGTALYTVDAARGWITFVSDTGGSLIMVNGRRYDMNAAAADVWRRKASFYAEGVDFSTDNHSIKRGHLAASALSMARQYEGISETLTGSVEIYRGDS